MTWAMENFLNELKDYRMIKTFDILVEKTYYKFVFELEWKNERVKSDIEKLEALLKKHFNFDREKCNINSNKTYEKMMYTTDNEDFRDDERGIKFGRKFIRIEVEYDKNPADDSYTSYYYWIGLGFEGEKYRKTEEELKAIKDEVENNL